MYVPSILQNRTYLITIIGFITTIATLGPFFVGQTLTTRLAAHELLHVAAITFTLSNLGVLSAISKKCQVRALILIEIEI